MGCKADSYGAVWAFVLVATSFVFVFGGAVWCLSALVVVGSRGAELVLIFVFRVLEIVAMSAVQKLPSLTVLQEEVAVLQSVLLPLSWCAHNISLGRRLFALFALDGRFSGAAKARSYYYYWRYLFTN